MKCNRCKGERIIWGKDMFGRAIKMVLLFVKKRRSGEMDILEVFWTNVDWHLKSKNVVLRKTHENARKKRAGIQLRTVEDIAKSLKIDDYSILFEQID